MAYSIYQIVLYRFPLKEVEYPRPCVIVQIAKDGTLAILPISTKTYGNDEKFAIHIDHPDFAATGLTDTSYVHGFPVLDIPPSWVLKTLGTLKGDMKKKFINWIV